MRALLVTLAAVAVFSFGVTRVFCPLTGWQDRLLGVVDAPPANWASLLKDVRKGRHLTKIYAVDEQTHCCWTGWIRTDACVFPRTIGLSAVKPGLDGKLYVYHQEEIVPLRWRDKALWLVLIPGFWLVVLPGSAAWLAALAIRPKRQPVRPAAGQPTVVARRPKRRDRRKTPRDEGAVPGIGNIGFRSQAGGRYASRRRKAG